MAKQYASQYQQHLPLVGGTEGQPAHRPADDDWRLDEPTRQAGRRGVAAARAALARSTTGSASQRAA